MVFHWSLIDSKSLQVSRTCLSILAILNNAVVWMVSTRLPTSKSTSPFDNPLVTVPKALITIGIIVTFMFHSFFNSLGRYLSFFSHSFSFILWSAGTAKSTIFQVLFFLLVITRSGLLAEIRWSICMSKSHRSLCGLFSRIDAGLCIYHLFVWSNLNSLHISQWITLPTQSCLVLYSFCALLLLFNSLWVFNISISWWPFTSQVSRTLLSILAILNNVVVWMIFTHPIISKPSSRCTNLLVTVPRAPITIGITVTFIFHNFFQFLSKVQVLILLFTFFQFYSVVCFDTKVHNSASSHFFFLLLLFQQQQQQQQHSFKNI